MYLGVYQDGMVNYKEMSVEFSVTLICEYMNMRIVFYNLSWQAGRLAIHWLDTLIRQDSHCSVSKINLQF